MRAVVQRVTQAETVVAGETVGEIGTGLLVFLGVGRDDSDEDLEYLVSKVANLRVFPDEEGKMNLSVKDVGGSVMVVSQFTLYGDCRRGRRPSFTQAAPEDVGRDYYERFVAALQAEDLQVATGRFQAHMCVFLCNDGPVTLLLDSRKEF